MRDAPDGHAVATTLALSRKDTLRSMRRGDEQASYVMPVILIGAIVVGILMRGRTILDTAMAAVNMSFLVGLGLVLQVGLFYWLYDMQWNWYLPDLKWGMKYYFDLLQLLPTGLMALVAPLIAMAVKFIVDRTPLGRAR